jgi:hypothetical protein
VTGGLLGTVGVGAGLGLLGLDPAGALVAAVALAAGARDRQVVVFGLVVLVGTTLFGAVLAVTVGERLARLDWASLVPHGALRAALEASAALALAVWVGVRLVRRNVVSEPRVMGAGSTGAIAAGVLFIGTAATDPTFAALVVLAGREASPAGVVLANSAWTLVSQAPLFLVVLAVLRGRHRGVVSTLQRLRERWAPRVRALVTAVLGLGALLLVVDVLSWITASFLIGR